MTRYTHDEWSDEQDETTVTVDGHDLSVAYWDSGEGESDAPPVVFLHGIPTWSFLWRDVAPAVAEETGRRVVVPDLLGYGNSAAHDGFDRSVRAQETMLADLLGEFGIEETALVAHDIGGGVAVRYAAHWPDSVSALVMSNAVCYDSWPVEFVTDLGLPDTARMDDEEFQATVSGAFSQGVYADEADEAFVTGMTHPWTREGGKTALARAAVATNTNHTTELDYGAIEADLLCLWGEGDVLQPIEYGERLAEEVGGEVVELEAYHWVVEDRPETYAAEVASFLAERGS
ncbi:MAG: alpha/beta fold hydrolase [Halorientalis sp.]